MACRVGCARLCFIFFTRRGLFMFQLMVQSLVWRFLSLRYARKSSIVFTCSGWSARPAANLRYVSPSSEGQTWPIISHNLVHTLLDDGLLNLKDIPTLSFFFMSPRSRLARAVYRILSFFSSQSYAHIYLSIQDDSQPSVIESHLNELWKMKRATSSKGLSGSVPARCGSASTVEHNHFSAAMEVAVSALATISSLHFLWHIIYFIFFRFILENMFVLVSVSVYAHNESTSYLICTWEYIPQ